MEWLRRGVSPDTILWTIEYNDWRTRRVIAAHDLYCWVDDKKDADFTHMT